MNNVFLTCFLAVLFANAVLGLAVKSILTWKARSLMKRFAGGPPPQLSPFGPMPMLPRPSMRVFNADLACGQAALRYGAFATKFLAGEPDGTGPHLTEAADLMFELGKAAIALHKEMSPEERERILAMKPAEPCVHAREGHSL